MKGRVTLCAATFVLTLVMCAGCKKDGPSTSAASAASASDDPVTLLDTGSEPRTPLRYTIAEDTITKSKMEFVMATLTTTRDAAALSVLPGLRLHIVSGPATAFGERLRFEVRITGAEAEVPPGTAAAAAEELERSAAVLEDIGGTVEMNARGLVLSAEPNDLTKSSEIPIRLLTLIINARTTLSRVALPAEPVGLGARWQHEKKIEIFGFEVQQLDTYTLIARTDDEIELDLAVRQNAPRQTVDFPDDRLSIEFEKMEANARGQILLDLHALESDAFASGKSESQLTLTGDDGTEQIEIDEAFEIRTTNTTVFE